LTTYFDTFARPIVARIVSTARSEIGEYINLTITEYGLITELARNNYKWVGWVLWFF
jgi:hypothetical protein